MARTLPTQQLEPKREAERHLVCGLLGFLPIEGQVVNEAVANQLRDRVVLLHALIEIDRHTGAKKRSCERRAKRLLADVNARRVKFDMMPLYLSPWSKE
jgi:hypothetical protein